MYLCPPLFLPPSAIKLRNAQINRSRRYQNHRETENKTEIATTIVLMSQLFYILHEPKTKFQGVSHDDATSTLLQWKFYTHTHTVTRSDAWMPTNILLNKNTIEKLPWWSRSNNDSSNNNTSNNKSKLGAQLALVAFNSFLWRRRKKTPLSLPLSHFQRGRSCCCCNSCCCCSCHWACYNLCLHAN